MSETKSCPYSVVRPKIDRIELVERAAYGCSITNGVQSPGAGSSFTKPLGDLCVGTLRKLFVIVCTVRHSHPVLRVEAKVMSTTIDVDYRRIHSSWQHGLCHNPDRCPKGLILLSRLF